MSKGYVNASRPFSWTFFILYIYIERKGHGGRCYNQTGLFMMQIIDEWTVQVRSRTGNSSNLVKGISV